MIWPTNTNTTTQPLDRKENPWQRLGIHCLRQTRPSRTHPRRQFESHQRLVVYKYDVFGRVAYTGINNAPNTRAIYKTIKYNHPIQLNTAVQHSRAAN